MKNKSNIDFAPSDAVTTKMPDKNEQNQMEKFICNFKFHENTSINSNVNEIVPISSKTEESVTK